MEKVKLSDLIISYETKFLEKDDFFGHYFKEVDLESKVEKLKMIFEVLGDVIMPLDHIKTFLYAGYWYQDKNYFKLTESMIKGIYEIIKSRDDMPAVFLDKLLFYYDEDCFRECNVIEYLDELFSEYGYSKIALEKYYDYLTLKKQELFAYYKFESEKLDVFSETYGVEFISKLKRIMLKYHIKFDKVIELLPSKDFIDKSQVLTPLGYFILSAEDLVVKILQGYIDLEKYCDDMQIVLGPCSTGDYVYTSFTKKEYLDELEFSKGIVKK